MAIKKTLPIFFSNTGNDQRINAFVIDETVVHILSNTVWL